MDSGVLQCVGESSLKKDKKVIWGKSLTSLPIFTRREIDLHIAKCGKRKGKTVSKTLLRGRLFRDERYLSSDYIYTASNDQTFMVKAKCRASMKKIIRDVTVHLSRRFCLVNKATCTCPAGQSGYCNHVMALLYELADYSLKSLTAVPEEKACTSKLRKWGVPGNKEVVKETVLRTTLVGVQSKKGIQPTLYDPRLNFDAERNVVAISTLREQLSNIDKYIGFSHIIPSQPVLDNQSRTKYGVQFLGSPLSYQLPPVSHDFKVISNIEDIPCSTQQLNNGFIDKLPLQFIEHNFNISDGLCTNEKDILLKLQINEEESHSMEVRTRTQRECKDWYLQRRNRLTSTKAHKVFIRKRNFQSLAKDLCNPKPYNALPDIVKQSMKHGTINEEIAKDKYLQVMNYQKLRNIRVRSVGLIVQPNIYWLGASPDGVIQDNFAETGVGLLEIKCPYSKRDQTPEEMLKDKSFYIDYDEEKGLFLKKNHPLGYYTQVQVAMGLSRVPWCHFVVYTYQGMFIIKVDFDQSYFNSVLSKMDVFYRDFFLKEVCERTT